MTTQVSEPIHRTADDQAMMKATPVGRYVPLICWAIVVLTLLFLSFKVMSLGFLPAGDARRHVGKAFASKQFADIMVARPDFTMDPSPGWEGLLRVLHHQAGWSADALMSFSIVSLLLCVFLLPVGWLRRPEAWLAALLAVMIAIPELMNRFTQARPFLFTEALLMAILFAWSTAESKVPSLPKMLLTSIAIMLSVWVHGTWYLWALPVAAFFLAGWWQTTVRLAVCVAIGVVAGAALTGHPVEYLRQNIGIALSISGDRVPPWMLVGELVPSIGEFATLTLVAIVFLWRKQQKTAESRLFCAPLLWLAAIGWILGFRADRFWADWGMPAVIVWLALQFEEIFAGAWNAVSPKRVLAACLLALPLYLHTTNDLDSRYSQSFREPFLDAAAPGMEGWTPEPGGIFYHTQMQFFYNTFYKNPQAEWRYILGFEPTLMTAEDLKILHAIQWSSGDPADYEPWIKRMTPADRLVIYAPAQPNFPELEWHHALANIWIGRMPRGNPR